MSKKDQTTGTNSRIISFTTITSKSNQSYVISSIQLNSAILSNRRTGKANTSNTISTGSRAGETNNPNNKGT